MKKLYLYLLASFLSFVYGYGQGSDVIIFIDNSSSVSMPEFREMRTSIDLIIPGILACNENNRVAVVHYGSISGPENANIYIESDFTNDVTVATNYVRRTNIIGGLDHAHSSIELIDKALQNISSANILGNVAFPTLTRNPANNLIVFMFSDAFRATITGLVNINSAALNSNDAFQNYTIFKNKYDSRFIVVLVPPNIPSHPIQTTLASNAAAAIASAGGVINAVVEDYPADPEFGQTNRRLLVSNNFLLTPVQIDIVTTGICQAFCPPNLTLTSLNNVTATSHQEVSDWIVATNNIKNPATGDTAIYHAGQFIELNSGFEAIYSSHFVAEIVPCKSPFLYKNTSQQDYSVQEAKDFVNAPNKIKIFPNPSNNSITISYETLLKNIQIISTDGKSILERNVNENTSQIDISNFVNGIYFIMIETKNGQFFRNKFIKN